MQWVLKPENSLVWYTEMLKFINHYSGIEKDEEMAEQDKHAGLALSEQPTRPPSPKKGDKCN